MKTLKFTVYNVHQWQYLLTDYASKNAPQKNNKKNILQSQKCTAWTSIHCYKLYNPVIDITFNYRSMVHSNEYIDINLIQCITYSQKYLKSVNPLFLVSVTFFSQMSRMYVDMNPIFLLLSLKNEVTVSYYSTYYSSFQ